MEAIVGFAIGFIAGIIVIGLAIELGMKKSLRSQPSSRPTHKWSTEELINPRVVAEYMGTDVDLPYNAKVVLGHYESKESLRGLTVKRHSGIKGNFILGDDRALILSGPLTKGELGVWTVEKEVLDKLDRYFNECWGKALPFEFEKN